MKEPISITSIATISPLGNYSEEVWLAYKSPRHYISKKKIDGTATFAAYLTDDILNEIKSLRAESQHLKKLDNSVLYAILVARKAIGKAGWTTEKEIGINIGSSRGATGLFEKFHKEYLATGKSSTLSSPTTTLGNISSWVAQDLGTTGLDFSHSVTCSTGLHAVLNAVAWIQSGLATRFLAGASEAAITPFTIAQMKAMKVYAYEDLDYPCQALNLEKKKNTMVLGDASGMVTLDSGQSPTAIAYITGIGYATESLKHGASISDNGESLQKAMKMAIGDRSLEDIDAIVMHAPGTIKGDIAEVNAIKTLFGENMPALTSNKWKVGHSFAASGILNLEMAILMLQNQEFIPVPFSKYKRSPKRLNNILVNAMGFGGNAVSILINKS